MCKKLEKVKCTDQTLLEGAGEIVYDRDEHLLRGQTRNIKSFYYDDQARFTEMLKKMQYRWHLYVSNLETDIIETKLSLILDSLTFKYTRQPEMLALVPDRVTEFNLRVNKTIKIANGYGRLPADQASTAEETGDEEKEQFFKNVYGEPDRAKDLEELFGSVMDHFDRLADEQKRALSSLASTGAGETKSKGREDKAQSGAGPASRPHPTQERGAKRARTNLGHDTRFTLHKHVAVAACEVAKRPKHHLLASILYLINFWLRKIHRRQELMGDAVTEKRPAKGDAVAEAEYRKARGKKIEQEYDKLLTAISQGLIENYGNDEYNHVLDLVKLQRGHESAFEHVLKEKQKRVQEKKAMGLLKEELRARCRRKQHVAQREAQYKFWEVEQQCLKCDFLNKPAATLCANCGSRQLKNAEVGGGMSRNDEEMFKRLIAEEVKIHSSGATKEQQAVENFLEQKYALKDSGYNSEFRQIQESSKKVKLGAHHLTLAREFAMKARMENENKKSKRNGI